MLTHRDDKHKHKHKHKQRTPLHLGRKGARIGCYGEDGLVMVAEVPDFDCVVRPRAVFGRRFEVDMHGHAWRSNNGNEGV
jgi:hypothetical protein